MKSTASNRVISLDAINEILEYNPETGDLFWRLARRGTRAGTRAGYIDRTAAGYIKIMIDKRPYYAHRLAWLLTHGAMPNEQIDHVNGCRADNRICNLRIASHAENCRNHKKRPLNTSGFKGVVRRGDRFLAQIKKDKKGFYLGMFDTAEAAHAAYCEAATKLYGEFARFQ